MRPALLVAGLLLGVVALAGCHGTMMRETETPLPAPASVSEMVATSTRVGTGTAVETPVSVGTPSPAPPFKIVDTPASVAKPAPVGSPAPVVTPTPVATAMVVAAEEARAVVLAGQRFGVELAVTPAERQRGLSGREFLDADAGMLFVFEEERVLSFWMRETLIPLDIVFIDGERRIVDIQTMVPELDVPTGDLTVYESAGPARYALEVNAGVVEELGLMAGMEVVFE